MKHFTRFFALSLLLLAAACQQENALTGVETTLNEITTTFRPDKRVAIFEVQPGLRNGKLLLTGKTDMPAAKDSLLARLSAQNIEFEEEISLLPAAGPGGKIRAVVINSVANLRSEPRHSAELATQATLGMPLKVLEKEGSWYRVQTPDRYLAWVDSAAIVTATTQQVTDWQRQPKIIFTETYGFARSAAERQAAPVADLVMGSILNLEGKEEGFYRVRYPDGRQAWVDTAASRPLHEWMPAWPPKADHLVKTSLGLMGVPYLWGGTSAKGMDCSGFTKTVYFMNGMIIPRDASQQVHAGEPVDTSAGFESLQPGDLLFFGRPATDTTRERVVHVGMWIGNMEFIHASGRVRVSSMDPQADNFDEKELNRYLSTRRYTGTDKTELVFSSEVFQPVATGGGI